MKNNILYFILFLSCAVQAGTGLDQSWYPPFVGLGYGQKTTNWLAKYNNALADICTNLNGIITDGELDPYKIDNSSSVSGFAAKSTSILAGNGLAGGGAISASRTLSIATIGVSNWMLVDGAVTASKVADGTLTTNDVDLLFWQVLTGRLASASGSSGVLSSTNDSLWVLGTRGNLTVGTISGDGVISNYPTANGNIIGGRVADSGVEGGGRIYTRVNSYACIAFGMINGYGEIYTQNGTAFAFGRVDSGGHIIAYGHGAMAGGYVGGIGETNYAHTASIAWGKSVQSEHSYSYTFGQNLRSLEANSLRCRKLYVDAHDSSNSVPTLAFVTNAIAVAQFTQGSASASFTSSLAVASSLGDDVGVSYGNITVTKAQPGTFTVSITNTCTHIQEISGAMTAIYLATNSYLIYHDTSPVTISVYNDGVALDDYLDIWIGTPTSCTHLPVLIIDETL